MRHNLEGLLKTKESAIETALNNAIPHGGANGMICETVTAFTDKFTISAKTAAPPSASTHTRHYSRSTINATITNWSSVSESDKSKLVFTAIVNTGAHQKEFALTKKVLDNNAGTFELTLTDTDEGSTFLTNVEVEAMVYVRVQDSPNKLSVGNCSQSFTFASKITLDKPEVGTITSNWADPAVSPFTQGTRVTGVTVVWSFIDQDFENFVDDDADKEVLTHKFFVKKSDAEGLVEDHRATKDT